MKLYSYYLAMFISPIKLHSFSLKSILLHTLSTSLFLSPGKKLGLGGSGFEFYSRANLL